MASTQIVGKATTSTKQKRMCKWVAWWLCNTPLWRNKIVGKATTSTKQKRMRKWAAWWLCNTPLWHNTNCWQSNNLHKTKCMCKWANKAFWGVLLQIQPPNKVNTKSEPQVTSSSHIHTYIHTYIHTENTNPNLIYLTLGSILSLNYALNFEMNLCENMKLRCKTPS